MNGTSPKVISLPSKLELSPEHLEHLRTSGLSDETLRLAQVHSEADPKRIAEHLGWKRWPKARGAGIVFPFFRPGTAEPYACRVRPDRPRRNQEGKPVKYEQPKRDHLGYGVIPYFPPRSVSRGSLDVAGVPLYWTEGEKKALLLDQLGYATIGGCGVSCFHDVEHRDAEGEYRLHEWIREHVALGGREHRIVFDSDASSNEQVMRAARVLAGMLERAGAKRVRFVPVPDAKDGSKQGIDDLFVAEGEPRTRGILDAQGEPIDALDPSDAFAPVHSMRGLGKAPVSKRLRFPDHYRVDHAGLWRWTPGKQPVLVTTRPVLLGRILLDLYTGEERVEVVFQREGRWRTVLVDRLELRDRRRVVSALAPLGVDVDSGTAGELVTFLSAFEAVNEKRLPRTSVVDRCGWHDTGKGRTFCAPGPVRGDDLVFDERQGRAKAVAGLRSEGELEAQLQTLREAAAAEPVAAAAIFAALAAPLLEPLSASGFALHLVGDSSRGKSSMLRIAASIFGDPYDETWVPTWDTTAVGLEVRAGILCDLPFCIDESGVTDADSRAKAVYSLINGTGRTRGRREGGLRETAQWRTVVLSTGETELVRRSAGATGSRVRVLPLRVRGFGDLGAEGVDDLRERAKANYGHAGRAWLEMVVDEGDWTGAREAYRELVGDFRARAGGQGLVARQAACWALLKLVEAKAHAEWGIGLPGGGTIDALFDGMASGARDEDLRPVSEVALDLVRDWVASKPDAFPRLKTSSSGGLVTPAGPVRERCGWITPDGEVWCIPSQLRGYLESQQLDEGVLSEWRDRGWIHADEGRCNTRRRLDGGRQRVVAFVADAFGLGPDPVVDS